MKLAQDRFTVQANKRRRPIDFGVKDKVWVTTKNWNTDRPSRKLGRQQEGPFEIIEKVGHSFKLRLLDHIKVHPIFSPDKLRLAAEDLLPSQMNAEAEPIPVNRENE